MFKVALSSRTLSQAGLSHLTFTRVRIGSGAIKPYGHEKQHVAHQTCVSLVNDMDETSSKHFIQRLNTSNP